MHDERRAAPRFNFPFHVEFTEPSGERRSGIIQNISIGGILLETAARIPLETVIEIHFLDGALEGTLSGKVIRAATTGAVAIAFVQLSPERVSLIRAAIDRAARAQ